jgi:two-component system phosphate regulon sensor histidine kinase PhoR
MKKSLFKLIIFIALFSLLGVVFTQVYWVRNALYLKEEQFKGSVLIGMKSVLNQLILLHNDSTLKQIQSPDPCIIEKTHVTDIIRPDRLDSLIRVEMGCMKISKDYEYAIYNKRNGRFAMGRFEKYQDELKNSEHQISISALFSPGDYHMTMYFPNQQVMILRQVLGWMLLSAGFIVMVFLSFWYTVFTVFRQKKISEMKSDFINNMTHEFKTPISTISLAAEMLMKPEVNQSSDKVVRYASVVFDENNRLQKQVEQILQIATIEKGEVRLKLKTFDLHRILDKTTEIFELQVQEKHGHIETQYLAEPGEIEGDKMHLMNVFSNLIDNAIKYSDKKPEIHIMTESDRKGIYVHVADKGIGIAPENHQLIFKNLYRVHTGDRHDVKGFGLGLYYVKRMVEMHHGFIKVESEPGKGSTFTVFLPYPQEHNPVNDE